jgi:hypothetical protein
VTRRVPRPETDSVKTLVQVPKAEVLAATQMTWSDLLKHAHAHGWEVRETTDFEWCAKGHTLLREGRDEMEGLPVLLYER